jgi:hypothetical protein
VLADAVCSGVTYAGKLDADSLYAQSYQSCSGNILKQEMDIYVDRCTFYLGICWAWSSVTNPLIATRTVYFAGGFWVPASGVARKDFLSPALYRARTEHWDWLTTGELGHYATAREVWLP